jgi:hypothetical protein
MNFQFLLLKMFFLKIMAEMYVMCVVFVLF